MPVAHRKSVESRAQKRTNVGGVRPDGCEVPPLPASKNKAAAGPRPLAADIGV